MGEVAKINSDLLLMAAIYYYDYNKAQEKILDMNGDDYKTFCLNIMQKEQEAVNQFAQNHQTSKKALQVKKMKILYSAYEKILSFNRHKNSAYRKKHKVPREQQEIDLQPETFEPSYYDFIRAEDLNNPVSLTAGMAYSSLINRIRFSDVVRNPYRLLEVKHKVSVFESINQKDSVISVVDSTFLHNPKTNEKIYISGKEAFEQIEKDNMKTYFGLDNGLATEIMYAQSKCEKISSMHKSFTKEDKVEIKEKISNNFIVDYLLNYSNNIEKDIQEKLAANKNKTGYVVNETPKTKADKLFEAIINKYKGKVVFIDFWATWCGPCMSGMEKMKALKEELKDENIEFVYITNQSSPVDIWNMVIPDIKGEHYRVEQDQWNYFASKFNISGIPHYVLVNQDGTVVMDKMYLGLTNEELKKLFYEYLTQ